MHTVSGSVSICGGPQPLIGPVGVIAITKFLRKGNLEDGAVSKAPHTKRVSWIALTVR